MQIIDNKSLLLRLREPNRVTSVIPSSHKVSDNEVMVKWGLEQVQTLNKLNINVPSPIQHSINGLESINLLNTRYPPRPF